MTSNRKHPLEILAEEQEQHRKELQEAFEAAYLVYLKHGGLRYGL